MEWGKSLLACPNENFAHVTRNTQKLVARDTAIISQFSKKFAVLTKEVCEQAQGEGDGNTVDKLEKGLASLIDKIKQLKQTLAERHGCCSSYLLQSKCRLSHLALLCSESSNLPRKVAPAAMAKRSPSKLLEMAAVSAHPPSIQERRLLDRFLVDYLARHHWFDTATALAADTLHGDSSQLMDTVVFAANQNVRDALLACDCRPALVWCAENRSRLKKNNSPLEFLLYTQEFIELLRRSEFTAALEYMQTHLSEFFNDEEKVLTLQELACCLTFRKNIDVGGVEMTSTSSPLKRESPGLEGRQDQKKSKTSSSSSSSASEQPTTMGGKKDIARAGDNPGGGGGGGSTNAPGPTWLKYAKYFDPARWQLICNQFSADLLTINGMTRHSLLSICLTSGLSALKTTYCKQASGCCGADVDGDSTASLSPVRNDDQLTLPFRPFRAFSSNGSGVSLPPAAAAAGARRHHLSLPFEEKSNSGGAGRNCPVCSIGGGELIPLLSVPQRSRSVLLCHASERLMNENDPPLVLPSGYIYSTAYLHSIASPRTGKERGGEERGNNNARVIVCPYSRERYQLSEARKAFIL